MTRLSRWLRSGLAGLMRRPLAACAAIVLPLALAGGAVAATTAFSQPGAAAAVPALTADTNAPCNTPPAPGHVQCFAIVRTPSDHKMTADTAAPYPTALGPADIQSAYNLPSATAGGGQTLADVIWGDDPNLESDLATFRAQYGLPACTTANGCFRKVNQAGQQSNYPSDQGTSTETSLDVDAFSAVCPKCNILVVEANSNSFADIGPAEDEAVTLGATEVSNSYGCASEAGCGDLQNDQYYNHSGVVITVSAGDDGWGVNYPSASPYVTAVGGTQLAKDTSVPRGWDETVWGNGSEGAHGDGTGSGCSGVEPQPAFQQGIAQLTAVCGHRATADVSADASPADGSGLSVYDSDPADGSQGWWQIGGTSLASPLIAATYALAGGAAAGTYPNTYPYLDGHRSADLNDITSGSNGDCGNVLCNAGTGWDGPTGLGTPDGVGAFTGAPQGQVSGQVTDTAGKPVTGATVTAQPSGFTTRTDATGDYDLTLPAGTYTLTADGYGYAGGTQSGVQVTANQTVTENFTLTGAPPGTLSGTVSDGSGQGWPLHAEITVPGDPNSPYWTSPYTGTYSIPLPQGDHTLTVSAAYPGYQAKTIQVTIGAATTQDITLDADLSACTAPGYGPDGLTQGFTGWTGGTAKQGWSVDSPGGAGWRFDNPGNQAPPPSGSTNPIPGTSDKEFVTFDPDHFAIADASYYAARHLDTTLTSAPVSLAGQATSQISFDSAYYPGPDPGTAQVQLSADGGRSWATVWHHGAGNALGPVTIAIPQAAGKTSVQARWVFDGSGDGYWAVGSVLIGTPSCVAQPGGLVTGVVTDKTTGDPTGAQITDAAIPLPYPWPDGIAEATDDPALPGGFYWLFTPAGSQQLTITQSGYTTATATVGAQPGTITRHDVALTPAGS